jgi:hypothetical protein
VTQPEGAGLGERLDRWSGKRLIQISDDITIIAEPVAQLDPQSLAAQSVGVLIGGPSLIVAWIREQVQFVRLWRSKPAKVRLRAIVWYNLDHQMNLVADEEAG